MVTPAMYLLDTNTLIYFFKNEGHVARRMQSVAAHLIQIPTVVWFELEYGVLRSSRPAPQRQSMAAVAHTYRTLPFDLDCARSAALIKHQLGMAGTPIGPCDLLIAGVARAHGLTLVTRNTREFERVPGLPVQDWYGASDHT